MSYVFGCFFVFEIFYEWKHHNGKVAWHKIYSLCITGLGWMVCVVYIDVTLRSGRLQRFCSMFIFGPNNLVIPKPAAPCKTPRPGTPVCIPDTGPATPPGRPSNRQLDLTSLLINTNINISHNHLFVRCVRKFNTSLLPLKSETQPLDKPPDFLYYAILWQLLS